jgi:hypothetical protein
VTWLIPTLTRTVAALAAVRVAALAAAAMAALAPAAAVAALVPAAPAYAPLDQPGPPLTVPAVQLRAALYCQPSVANARVEPVLLNPATGVTPQENYSWNWEPALTRLGIPWCTYTAPHHALDDIETSGEYLVHAIRAVHALAGRRIAVMGHSQGGMSMRWGLRFWPDTRAMVDDVIGFSGSNHGTTAVSPIVCAGGCPPAGWQQAADSRFIAALNSRAETFPGISYTEVYTTTDEVVQPNSGPHASAALHTGAGSITNVATQQLCPRDFYEHLTVGTVDPVAYALALDALSHPGPADPTRVARLSGLCSQATMPGVNLADPNTAAQILAALPTLGSVTVGATATLTAGAPVLAAEPPLACYAFAACTGAAAPRLRVTSARTHRRPGGTIVRVHVGVVEGDALVPVPRVRLRLAGASTLTGASGTATLTVPPRRRGPYRLTAARAGCIAASGLVRLL